MSIYLIAGLFAIRSFNGLLIKSDSSVYVGMSLIRYQLKKCIGDFSFEGALETSISYGEMTASLLPPAPAENYFHWTKELIDQSRLRAVAYIDRLNLRWSTENMDLTVGRQAIGFGKGHYITLWDAFAPFMPYSLDFSFKRGVDAARVELAFGTITPSYIHTFSGTHAASLDFQTGNWNVALMGLYRDRFFGGYALEGNAMGTVLYSEGVFSTDGMALSIGMDAYVKGAMISIAGAMDRNSGLDWYPVGNLQIFSAVDLPEFRGFQVSAGLWYFDTMQEATLLFSSIKRQEDNSDITFYGALLKTVSRSYILAIYYRWFF